MDRSPSPLFRPAAVEAASGTQIGAALATHWRGVTVFTAVAIVLFAALLAFVAVVEYAPMHRVAAFVDTRGTSQTGKPGVAIAPHDVALVVKLLVAPSAVASIRPGTAFRLAFRAYPEDRFGLFEAEVDGVEDIASLPGDVAKANDAGDGVPIRVATAPLPVALTSPQGQRLPLQPGMLADALVPGERRTLAAWLLDPILRGRAASAGEARR